MDFNDIKQPVTIPDNPTRVFIWGLRLRNAALNFSRGSALNVPIEIHWKPKGSDIEIVEYFAAAPEWRHIEKYINEPIMKVEVRCELKMNGLI